MRYTGPVFRPPFEAGSLLLEVTTGCSHNECTFCTMYRGVRFQASPMEQIEADLCEARRAYRRVKRVFLVNADPFALSAKRLKDIAVKINEILPEVETISAYASIKNIRDKTDVELKELRTLKINELNIGVESGLEGVLRHFNKGFTLAEAKTQLHRLKGAGMDFSVNIILGAAGVEKSLENAIANSELLNEVKPYLIFVATLHIDQGSPLHEEWQAGRFVENTLGLNLLEELEMLKRLTLEKTVFFGMHTSNVVPVAGVLPEEKDELIESLEKGIASIPAGVLDSKPAKGNEGTVSIDY